MTINETDTAYYEVYIFTKFPREVDIKKFRLQIFFL